MRFKRPQKEWSVVDMHRLYIRALERSNKRQKEFSEHLDKIMEEIPASKDNNYGRDGHRKVYYIQKVKDIEYTHSYSLSYMREYKTIGFSRDTINFSKMNRIEKCEFVLNNEKAFELGQKMFELEKLKSYLHGVVFREIKEIVEEKIRNDYKDEVIPNILSLEIDGYNYTVIVDKSQNYYWPKSIFYLNQKLK